MPWTAVMQAQHGDEAAVLDQGHRERRVDLRRGEGGQVRLVARLVAGVVDHERAAGAEQREDGRIEVRDADQAFEVIDADLVARAPQQRVLVGQRLAVLAAIGDEVFAEAARGLFLHLGRIRQRPQHVAQVQQEGLPGLARAQGLAQFVERFGRVGWRGRSCRHVGQWRGRGRNIAFRGAWPLGRRDARDRAATHEKGPPKRPFDAEADGLRARRRRSPPAASARRAPA